MLTGMIFGFRAWIRIYCVFEHLWNQRVYYKSICMHLFWALWTLICIFCYLFLFILFWIVLFIFLLLWRIKIYIIWITIGHKNLEVTVTFLVTHDLHVGLSNFCYIYKFIGHDYGEIITNIESACITCINRLLPTRFLNFSWNQMFPKWEHTAVNG